MKYIICLIAFSMLGGSATFAGSVDGYFNRSGTYVAPHYQSRSNGTVTDNYSFKGNANPYSGTTGTDSYSHDRTSPYFNGMPSSSGRYGHSGSRY